VGTDTKLLLLSRKVFSDYSLLEKYFEVCGEGASESIPRPTDIEYVKYLVSKGSTSLDHILNELKERLLERVNANCSLRAAKEVLGVNLPESHSVALVSVQLAGWILEIAEALGVIKLRPLYEKKERT
jgi:hypothetical protein